jgi:hypothetical protein
MLRERPNGMKWMYCKKITWTFLTILVAILKI